MRRLKKSERVLLVMLLVVATLAWVYDRYHIRIEAWWWHHQHGEVVTVAEYRVPAPDDWYVQDTGQDSYLLVLLNRDNAASRSAGNGKLPFTAVIDVSVRSWAFTPEKLDRWTSFDASQKKKRGVEPVFRKFSFDGETLSCVGGEKFSQALEGKQFYESDPSLWSCWSSGRLQLRITATDAHMPLAWGIVSHIRRKS